jgi:hypothetical protein
LGLALRAELAAKLASSGLETANSVSYQGLH